MNPVSAPSLPGATLRTTDAAGVRYAVARWDAPAHSGSADASAAAGGPGPDASPVPPVLLLHGVPQTALMWRYLAPELVQRRPVIAPDLKGLGRSGTDGRYEVTALADGIAHLLRTELPGIPGGPRVDVVGHDWGVVIGLALARQHPDLVRRLVVVNGPYRSINVVRAAHALFFALPALPEKLHARRGAQLVRDMIRAVWRSGRTLEPQVLEEYVAAYDDPARFSAMLGYYRANVRSTAGRRARGLLARGKRRPEVPAVRAERHLVVWGAADPVLPLSVGESVVRDLGEDTAFVTVPGAGHFVLEEAPEVVNPVIVGFLDETGWPRSRPPSGPPAE